MNAVKSPLIQVDNLDDRREVWTLMKRLSPARRVQFLEWCCSQARLGKHPGKPVVAMKTKRLAAQARWDDSAEERLQNDLWMDLWMLVNNYDFDLDAGLARLVEMVRGRRNGSLEMSEREVQHGPQRPVHLRL